MLNGSVASEFQFQYGSIKRRRPTFLLCCSCHFNSNMVRLKATLMANRDKTSPVFQFQYGSIKRDGQGGGISDAPSFQFQYGSIKRGDRDTLLFKVFHDFNSNMVRLKASTSRARSTRESDFNSNMVRLKDSVPLSCHNSTRYFNSNMVRLKASTSRARSTRESDFNSNMVRLKGIMLILFLRVFLHFNSNMVRLKDSVPLSCHNSTRYFNSNMVRLKVGDVIATLICGVRRFQFQYGSIKS